jgi:hypothetical protein
MEAENPPVVEVPEVPVSTEVTAPVVDIPAVVEVVPAVEVPVVEVPVVEVPVIQEVVPAVQEVASVVAQEVVAEKEVAVVKALPAESEEVFVRTKTSFELVFEKLCDYRVVIGLVASASLFWAVKSFRSRK